MVVALLVYAFCRRSIINEYGVLGSVHPIEILWLLFTYNGVLYPFDSALKSGHNNAVVIKSNVAISIMH